MESGERLSFIYLFVVLWIVLTNLCCCCFAGHHRQSRMRLIRSSRNAREDL